jgi:hypothetical protein
VLKKLSPELRTSYQVSFSNKVFPSEDADEEEDRRNAPGHANHDDHFVAGSPGPVLGSDLHRAEPAGTDVMIFENFFKKKWRK